MNPLPLVASGWTALILWGLSLFCDFSAASGYGEPLQPEGGVGYILLFTGWLGPLGYNFAWFANFPFGLAVYRLVRGRRAGHIAATSSAVIGFSALIPHRTLDPGFQWTSEILVGPAINLWLAAMAVVAVAQFFPADEEE